MTLPPILAEPPGEAEIPVEPNHYRNKWLSRGVKWSILLVGHFFEYELSNTIAFMEGEGVGRVVDK